MSIRDMALRVDITNSGFGPDEIEVGMDQPLLRAVRLSDVALPSTLTFENNMPLRGPYEHAATASAVRTEMERQTQYDRMNLWVSQISSYRVAETDLWRKPTNRRLGTPQFATCGRAARYRHGLTAMGSSHSATDIATGFSRSMSWRDDTTFGLRPSEIVIAR